MIRLLLILGVFSFGITNIIAQGTIEDYGTEKKKKVKKGRENLDDYDEFILENGFFLDGLFQWGAASITNTYSGYNNNTGNYSTTQSTENVQGIGVGFRLGSKWYFGNMKTYRPGLAAIWGRLNLFLVQDATGGGVSRPMMAITPANLGFINAFSFGGKVGLEVNLNFGLNLIHDVSYGKLIFGYLVNPNIKFRYKSLAVGLDISIMAGNAISYSSDQMSLILVGLTIGGKF